MSITHGRAAWKINVTGGPLTKLVLMALADHACENCGLAWPGSHVLVRKTLLGKTRIVEALQQLIQARLIVVAGHPKGGRARTTEYLILPDLGLVRDPPPCPRCSENLKHRGTPSRNGAPGSD